MSDNTLKILATLHFVYMLVLMFFTNTNLGNANTTSIHKWTAFFTGFFYIITITGDNIWKNATQRIALYFVASSIYIVCATYIC